MTTTTTSTQTDLARARPRPMATIELMVGAVAALILLNLVQVAAGLAQADPSPPGEVIPFIAATASVGVIALPMVRAGQRLGYGLAIAFAVVSMIGMGPHKLFLENGGIVAPVAIVGFAAEIALIWAATQRLRDSS